MDGTKLISSKTELHVQVLQRNMDVVVLPAEDGQIPHEVRYPVFAIFFNILRVTVQMADGTLVETASDPLDASERHFWRGQFVIKCLSLKHIRKKMFTGFLGHCWEKEPNVRFIRARLRCFETNRSHCVYFPFVPGDIMHTCDE